MDCGDGGEIEVFEISRSGSSGGFGRVRLSYETANGNSGFNDDRVNVKFGSRPNDT